MHMGRTIFVLCPHISIEKFKLLSFVLQNSSPNSSKSLSKAPPPLIPVANGLRPDNLSSHKGVGRNGLDKQRLVDTPAFRPDPTRQEPPYKVRKVWTCLLSAWQNYQKDHILFFQRQRLMCFCFYNFIMKIFHLSNIFTLSLTYPQHFQIVRQSKVYSLDNFPLFSIHCEFVVSDGNGWERCSVHQQDSIYPPKLFRF